MIKLAILGSSGYIGSYLTSSLKKKCKIISHSRKKINDISFNKQIHKIVIGDIRNKKTIHNILIQKPDSIIYTISLNHIDSEKNISRSIENNFLPLCELIEQIIKKKTKNKNNIFFYNASLWKRIQKKNNYRRL